MPKTTPARSLVLDFMLTAKAVTRPTELYVALHTGDPGAAGTANELTVGDGYGRQAVAFDDAAFPYESTEDIIFGPNTGTDWGAITHYSIWTAETDGTPIYYTALTTERTIEVGDDSKFEAGSITVDEE